MGALASAVQQGKALYVGISNYDPEQTRAAQAALAATGVPLLIHQPRYSMFDRHIEDGLFPVLEEVGAGCIVFSPLAQGLLTDRYLDGSVPEDSRAATSSFLSSDRIDQVYLDRVRGLAAIAQDRGQSVAQLALSWVLRTPPSRARSSGRPVSASWSRTSPPSTRAPQPRGDRGDRGVRGARHRPLSRPQGMSVVARSLRRHSAAGCAEHSSRRYPCPCPPCTPPASRPR